MKNILLLLILTLFLGNMALPQAKVEKVDPSQIPERVSSSKSLFIPKFPLKDVVVKKLYEGLQSATSIEQSIDIGKNLVLEIDFDTIPRITKKGKVLREIEVLSPDANTLSVNFRTIQLAESAEVYIINDAESYILGPITRQDVSKTTNFDPGFIPGDKIRILLSEDEQDSGKSKLSISRIGHILFDYFAVHKFQTARVEGIDCFGPGCSSSCQQNISCFSGSATEARAVALITYSSPGSNNIRHAGTGYLVNNGAQNKRPLFLSMIHGIAGYEIPGLKLIFHYQSPQCSPTTSGTKAYFVSGATQLANDPGNDLRILELNSNPGTSSVFSGNPVSYLGWSIIDEPISSVIGIGHPKGDVKKYMAGGVAVPIVEPGSTYGVWKYSSSNGFPEVVSSGTPTLNPAKQVIGSLRSGSAVPNCSNFTTIDYYSVRISRSWGMLCQYLDPNNEGIVAINTYTTGSPVTKITPSVSGPSQVCVSLISVDRFVIDFHY